MTDRIAFAIAAVIIAAILTDLFANGGEALLFLMRKLFLFIEYVSFWR